MSTGMEDRLRAAYQAKAEQLSYRELVQLRAERSNELSELLMSDDLPITRLKPPPSQLRQRRRRSSWLAPAAAAAAVAAVAAAAFALSTSGSHRVVPAPPASRVSSPTGSISPSVTNSASGPSSPSAAPSTAGATGPSYLPAGEQGDRSQVPWQLVGAGWTLAQWTGSSQVSDNGLANPIRDQAESIFLVDPVGGRYLITGFASGDQWTLQDWAADGQIALLRGPGSEVWSKVAILDLSTGQLQALPVPGGLTAESLLAGQDGRSVLVDSAGGFQQLSDTGEQQLRFPRTVAGNTGLEYATISPDRGLIAFGTDKSMVLLTASATFVRTLDGPGLGTGCRPLRWSSDQQLIAQCDSGYWLVPDSGAAPTKLSDRSAAGSQVQDAMPVGNVVLIAVGTSCADSGLASAEPGGQPTPVQLGPAAGAGGVRFVQAGPSTVQLLSRGGCGYAATLTSRDIDTSTDTTLLGDQVNGGGVIAAVGYHGTVG